MAPARAQLEGPARVPEPRSGRKAGWRDKRHVEEATTPASPGCHPPAHLGGDAGGVGEGGGDGAAQRAKRKVKGQLIHRLQPACSQQGPGVAEQPCRTALQPKPAAPASLLLSPPPPPAGIPAALWLRLACFVPSCSTCRATLHSSSQGSCTSAAQGGPCEGIPTRGLLPQPRTCTLGRGRPASCQAPPTPPPPPARPPVAPLPQSGRLARPVLLCQTSRRCAWWAAAAAARSLQQRRPRRWGR